MASTVNIWDTIYKACITIQIIFNEENVIQIILKKKTDEVKTVYMLYGNSLKYA